MMIHTWPLTGANNRILGIQEVSGEGTLHHLVLVTKNHILSRVRAHLGAGAHFCDFEIRQHHQHHPFR